MADKTLADITAEAQTLQQEIQAQGINASDKGSIVASAKRLLALIDAVQPHINTAHTAFGAQEQNISKVNELRNKLNKIIAAYSS